MSGRLRRLRDLVLGPPAREEGGTSSWRVCPSVEPNLVAPGKSDHHCRVRAPHPGVPHRCACRVEWR